MFFVQHGRFPWCDENDCAQNIVHFRFVREKKFQKGDVLICISVHGGSGSDNAGLWSQNLLKAMEYVNNNDGRTIGLSGFDGGVMKQIANVCIVVPINSTPHVESFHLVLEHLIISRLGEKIRES